MVRLGRRLQVWIVLSSAVVLLFSAAAITPGRGVRINRATYERITNGMTRADVESLLGGPAGDHTLFVAVHHRPIFFRLESCLSEVENKEWIGDDGAILVRFDRQGLAFEKEFAPRERFGTRESTGYMLRRLIRRLLIGTEPDPPFCCNCLLRSTPRGCFLRLGNRGTACGTSLAMGRYG